MKSISEMTTAEMLAEYNALTGKNTSKFASRAKGEEQLQKAREGHASQLPSINAEEEAHLFGATPKAGNGARQLAKSIAVSETWNDPKVAAKRKERHHVEVVRKDGQPIETKTGNELKRVYRSTLAAFNDLGMPYKEHFKFRKELKKAGSLERDGFVFTALKVH